MHLPRKKHSWQNVNLPLKWTIMQAPQSWSAHVTTWQHFSHIKIMSVTSNQRKMKYSHPTFWWNSSHICSHPWSQKILHGFFVPFHLFSWNISKARLFSSITVGHRDHIGISSGIQLFWVEKRTSFFTSIHSTLKNPGASYP